jgi:hypothetical protein
MSDDVEFGDITSDDVYTEGDEDVNWDQVEAVASQIDSIQAIENDQDRLEAAQIWATELSGGTA